VTYSAPAIKFHLKRAVECLQPQRKDTALIILLTGSLFPQMKEIRLIDQVFRLILLLILNEIMTRKKLKSKPRKTSIEFRSHNNNNIGVLRHLRMSQRWNIRRLDKSTPRLITCWHSSREKTSRNRKAWPLLRLETSKTQRLPLRAGIWRRFYRTRQEKRRTIGSSRMKRARLLKHSVKT